MPRMAPGAPIKAVFCVPATAAPKLPPPPSGWTNVVSNVAARRVVEERRRQRRAGTVLSSGEPIRMLSPTDATAEPKPVGVAGCGLAIDVISEPVVPSNR